jgi:hypothetical protein
MAQGNYREEFSDYRPEDMPAIPDGWRDTSWHNDTCPSFDTGAGLVVFVDYAKPEEREIPESTRFSVHLVDLGHFQPVADFDAWPDVLAYVESAAGLPACFLDPIDDEEAARNWLAGLHAADMLWHMDDSAASIVNLQTGESLWKSEAQAAIAEERRQELWRVADKTPGFDPHEVCLSLMAATETREIRAALVAAGWTLADMGGGCVAYRKELPAGGYMLATDQSGVELPAARSWLVGTYDAEGSPLASVDCDEGGASFQTAAGL